MQELINKIIKKLKEDFVYSFDPKIRKSIAETVIAEIQAEHVIVPKSKVEAIEFLLGTVEAAIKNGAEDVTLNAKAIAKSLRDAINKTDIVG